MEADGLGGDHVHQRPALDAGEHNSVEVFGILFFAKDGAAPRPAQGFVRGGGDEVGVREGARVQASGDQSGDMRHVHHQYRAAVVGNGGKAREIESAWISAGPGQNELGRCSLARRSNSS